MYIIEVFGNNLFQLVHSSVFHVSCAFAILLCLYITCPAFYMKMNISKLLTERTFTASLEN